MIMIDSNMWIYYFDESLEEHKYVKEPMRDVILEKRILANTIVIQEVAHYLIRHESTKEFWEAFKKLEMKFDEIDNFGAIDPVPEKNDPVNGGGA